MPLPSRISGTKRYKCIFFLICEGHITEPSYINLLRPYYSSYCQLKMCKRKPHESSLSDLHKQAKKTLNELKLSDQLWIIADRDPESHNKEQLNRLYQWTKSSTNCFLIINNPRFELWLLLHFTDKVDKKMCLDDTRLNKYLPNFSQNKDLSKHRNQLSITHIHTACSNAIELKYHELNFDKELSTNMVELISALNKLSTAKKITP